MLPFGRLALGLGLGSAAAPVFDAAKLFGKSSGTGLWWPPNPNPILLSNEWQDNSKTTLVSATGQPVGRYEGFDPSHTAVGGTLTTARPTWNQDGDGTGHHAFNGAQYFTTPITLGSVFTFVVVFYATGTGTQNLLGATDTTPHRAFLNVNTSGQVALSLGNTSGLIKSSADIRSTRAIAAIRLDGTNASLWVNRALIGTAAFSGGFPSLAAWIGALNNNGSPSNYLTGKIYSLFYINKVLSDADLGLVSV